MNIYVANFPHSTTEDELREAFEAYGAVSTVSVIKDKFTGQPRGFAFVEMPTKVEAKAAIEQLDGRDLGGRPLTVNEARPREERSGGPGNRSGGRNGGRRSF
ncbi:MAG TPA: RNA-binding protein [Rubricoccaceae bacterium]|nr:RNA-binding protein [Rubricoccaceae bacterium]